MNIIDAIIKNPLAGIDPDNFIPTRDQIAALEVGDMAPDCFGNLSPITRISSRRKDVAGKLFICYDVQHGKTPGSSISSSMKEGEEFEVVGGKERKLTAGLPKCELKAAAEMQFRHPSGKRFWLPTAHGLKEVSGIRMDGSGPWVVCGKDNGGFGMSYCCTWQTTLVLKD